MQLKQLAADNERIVAAGHYEHPTAGRVDIEDAVRQAADATRGYEPAELAELPIGAANRTTRIEVTGESSTQAAKRLHDNGTAGRIAVLNFASARNPGGGYLTGARAQEEDLCRSSALYTCLLRVPDYYAAHRSDKDPVYSHRLIHSPGVPVFRDHDGALLPAPYPVTFLTCAAPNAGIVAQRTPERLAEIPAILTERAAGVLAAAAHHEVDTLILGAWGCGVFRNSPTDVATAFATHLLSGRFANTFDRVTFAVYDRTKDQRTLAAFRGQYRDSAAT